MTAPVTEPAAERSIFTPPLPRRDAHQVRRARSSAGRSSAASSSCIGLLSLWQRGLNLGIDFEGGVVWEVPAGDVSVAEAQDALADNGLAGLTVQTLTADDEVRLRVEAEPLDDPAEAQEVSARSWPSSPAPTSTT